MHDPIEININISKIPKGRYWKLGEDVMLTVVVGERQQPSEKGYTHHASYYDKEKKETNYVGFGKFKPYEKKEVADSELPPTSVDDITDAEIVDDGKPVPF